jgi:hypothetical protein
MWGPGEFAQQFSPSDYCLAADDTWSELELNTEQVEYVNVFDVTGKSNYLGYDYGPGSGPGQGIRKSKGPWCELFGSTGEMAGIDICTDPSNTAMMDQFNDDLDMQFVMSQIGVPPLSCQTALLSGAGPGWNEWGSGGNGNCIEFSYSEEDSDGDGIIDIANWVSEVIDCPTTVAEIYERGLSAVDDIQITQWFTATPQVLNIPIPDVNDPRLVPVPRTQLDPGLYEFRVNFDNGTVWRKFRSYDTPVYVAASFASFTDVNVYPVPVDDQTFSVDFETLAPLSVSISVINNQGTSYYQKNVPFPVAGRNKHVITMQNQWPSGIYHVISTYEDGSSESISITVQ